MLGTASCWVAGGGSLVAAFCPIVVLESFYLRLWFYVTAFAAGAGLGLAGLWVAARCAEEQRRRRRLVAAFGLAVNLLGLIWAGVYFYRLFLTYRLHGWM